MSSGIGPLVLSAAKGSKRFNSAMSIGDTCWYSVDWFSPVTGEALAFECGTATYTALDTLTRTGVQESTSGVGVLHAFPTGKKRVSMTILAPDAETGPQWREALGITEADGGDGGGDSVMALMLSISSYARSETFLLRNGG